MVRRLREKTSGTLRWEFSVAILLFAPSARNVQLGSQFYRVLGCRERVLTLVHKVLAGRAPVPDRKSKVLSRDARVPAHANRVLGWSGRVLAQNNKVLDD